MAIDLDVSARDFPIDFYKTQKVLKEILDGAAEIHEALKKDDLVPCVRCQTLGNSCECVRCHGTGLVRRKDTEKMVGDSI